KIDAPESQRDHVEMRDAVNGSAITPVVTIVRIGARRDHGGQGANCCDESPTLCHFRDLPVLLFARLDLACTSSCFGCLDQISRSWRNRVVIAARVVPLPLPIMSKGTRVRSRADGDAAVLSRK